MAPPVRRMVIGAYLEHAAPEHPAGAEWSIQDLFAWLAARGHDCRVLARGGQRAAPITLNGVKIGSGDVFAEEHFDACDIMLTQLEATMSAQLLAVEHQTPLVTMLHSPSQLASLGVMPSSNALVVANSEHVLNASRWWPGRLAMLRPPVDEARVRSEVTGACATLVNLSHNKGALALHSLARRMEGTPFMGVMGSYGEQAIGPDGMPGTAANETPTGLPQNLRVFPPTERIAEMFAFTRVLLVLSKDESYGRIAHEAMVSGIPVICTRTPGLTECCGDAGHYINHRDSRDLDALVKLAYTDEWNEWSIEARAQARLLHERNEDELAALERELYRIAATKPRMRL